MCDEALTVACGKTLFNGRFQALCAITDSTGFLCRRASGKVPAIISSKNADQVSVLLLLGQAKWTIRFVPSEQIALGAFASTLNSLVLRVASHGLVDAVGKQVDHVEA